MGIRRGQHFTDIPIVGRNRRRSISNWVNYREPGKPWAASVPETELALSVPDNWAGSFDFQNQSLKGAIQVFTGDTTDVSNTAMVGVRRADKPESWLNLKALDVNPVQPVIKDKTTQWKDLWTQSDLIYTPHRHKLKEEIILKAPGHPLVFSFTLSLAPDHTIEFVGGGARILDDKGAEVFRLNVPWGVDSSTVSLDTPEGHKSIGVILREGGSHSIKGKQYQVIELVLEEKDLEKAVYPVTVDPTVPITGTTDIEDATIIGGANADKNWGGTTLYLGAGDTYRCLVRIANISSIPAGTITGFRLYVFNTQSNPTVLHANLIVDANDWVEGTLSGGVQAGSCCWNHTKYDTDNWVGSVGCGQSGVDYDVDLPPLESNITGAGWHTFALKTEWPPLWRDGIRAPNGFRLFIEAADSNAYLKNTEAVGDQLYFEIDYEEAASDNAMFFGSNF